jgi:Arc/MetJ-type ribon-helix-helix transcriptional regulator
MQITLSPQTQRLLEERLRDGDYASPDDLIRTALETLEGESYEDLDADTRAAIERADAEAERSGGIPLDEAFRRLREKHFGS